MYITKYTRIKYTRSLKYSKFGLLCRKYTSIYRVIIKKENVNKIYTKADFPELWSITCIKLWSFNSLPSVDYMHV